MFCPKCSTQQAEGAQYCANCGTKLDQINAVKTRVLPSGIADYAGFWRRFAAYIIDGIILNVFSFGIGWVLGLSLMAAGEGDEGLTTGLAYLVAMGFSLLYWILFESSPLQATPGKLALGIKVTDINGNRISIGRAAGRYFSKIISSLILGIGYLMIAWTEKKQGLHDMIANTLVIKK